MVDTLQNNRPAEEGDGNSRTSYKREMMGTSRFTTNGFAATIRFMTETGSLHWPPVV